MEFRSPIAKVKGLGSGKNGTAHFIHQRLTAILLIPLSVWFVTLILSILRAPSYEEKIFSYMTSQLNSALLLLFLSTALYHGMIGMKVVIEDYIHCRYIKISLLIAMYAVVMITLVMAVISTITLYFSLQFTA